MTIENIGLERLPNIYFKKINLEDHDTKSFKVTSELVMLDELLDDSFVWSIDPLFSGFMKVCVIETSNLELAQQITDGVQNPHPTLLKSNPLSMDGTKVHIFGFKDFIKMEDEDDRHFKLQASMPKANETENLTLFAFTYIDHKEISNYLHIKLTGPLQQYMGPVVSETVMTNRTIQETSVMFDKPDGSIWSGPVHQGSDGEWYSGASSSSEESLRLTRKTVQNSKLTDSRSANLMNRSSSDFKSLTIFSDLMTALNSDADLFGMFSINIKQFVLTKTESGKHIYGLGEKTFSSFLDSVTINSLEIRRRQVRMRKQNNKLGTAKFSMEDVFPYTTIVATQESSSRNLVENENIKEIMITQDKNIRSFQFADFDKTENVRGEFVYEAHLTMLDKSQAFLESIIADAERILNGLKTDVNLLNKVGNFNTKLDRLEIDPPTTIDLYINQFYDYYSLLKDVDEDLIEQMKKNKKSLFKKDTYKKRYGAEFIRDVEKLISTFRRRFGIFPSGLRESKKMPSSGYPPNLITISKTFDSTVDFSSVKASYDVLGVSNNKSIASMTKDQFILRGDQEIDRFFDLSNSRSSDELLDMDNEDSNAIKDLETSKLNFLSPLNFQAEGQKKDLSSLANVDLDDISVKFVKHMVKSSEKKIPIKKPKLKRSKPKRRRGKRLFGQKRRNRRIKFKFRPKILKINNLKLPEHLDSSKYLGDNSEFVNIENNLDKAVVANDSDQANIRFSIANEISVKRSKKRFDLREKGNFYERFKSSKNYTPKKLRRLPVGIKSIFNSRSKSAKNNIMEEESDILKSVDTKVTTEMMFHANQKIEALMGYEKAPDGTDLMNKPIWGEITPDLLQRKKMILCRSVYAEMPELGIVPAPEFKLKVQNEIFIIEGDGAEEQALPEIPDEQLPEVENVVFASSNIVIQPTGVSNA